MQMNQIMVHLANFMRLSLRVVLLILIVVTGCDNPTKNSVQERNVTKQSMNPRTALIAKVRQQGDPNDTNSLPILVPLEDFFEGNDDLGSIGPNLNPPPGPKKFYKVLKSIKERSEVQDVLVRIRMIESDEMWPYSDTVYIITSAAESEVKSWLSYLQPDEVFSSDDKQHTPDWPRDKPFVQNLKPGMHIIYAWWD